MRINDDHGDLQSKLELIIEENPNSIILVDRELTLKEIIVAKDDLFHQLVKVGLGKRPEEIFEEEKTLSQFDLFRSAVNKVLDEGVPVEVSCELPYNGEDYYYLSIVKPFDKEQVIVYVRNINILRNEKNTRELLQTILDRLPVGVFVKDAKDHFNYLYWNRFMELITGLGMSDIEGHDDTEVSYDALISAEQRLELDRKVISSGHTIEFSGRVKTVNGDYKDIEVTKFPISLSNGQPLLLALWRDITQKLGVEKALKRTQGLSKMALLSSDIQTYSVLLNPDTTTDFMDSIVQVNAKNIEDENVEEILWPQFLAHVHPDDREIFLDLFRSLGRGDVSEAKREIRVKYSEKDHYHWREAAAYIYERNEKGHPLVILGCSTNIEKRKNQQLDLVEAREKAEIADKMKSKYLADMSHEIRTPLNAITGFSEMMAFADSDEERQSYYEIIKANNQLLMQLINDILDLSKIEADAIKISYAKIDLNEMMDTTYVSAKPRITKGVQFFLEKGLDSCMFGTDEIRLLQLINNLVNNAIKNTKQGSITMGYIPLEDGLLKFYVKDTGFGIAEEKLQSLFDRFVKVNDYVEGIGLGLAICKSLVTKMGGSLAVESRLGEGSTFSFVLPSHEEK